MRIRINRGQAANVLGGVYYAVTAVVALVGATTGTVELFGWTVWSALAAVSVVELGGIALSARADARRALGERALPARVLSAGIAGFAVAFQWIAHSDHRQGLLFAGTSAIAYCTWLIHSADRRRDALRAAGALPPQAPAYGIEWLRHPALVRRARQLALRSPQLGLLGSLDAARDEVRRERRTAAIAGVLRRKLTTAASDPMTAEIAVTVYDIDELAARLAATADYDGLTALLAADITAAALAAPASPAALDHVTAIAPVSPAAAAWLPPKVPTQPVPARRRDVRGLRVLTGPDSESAVVR